MSQQEFDPQQTIQEAVVILEDTLRGKGRGNDQNLITALEILRNHEPVVSFLGPVPSELTDQEREIVTVWNESLEPKIVAHARPTGLRKGTLLVSVDSSIWLSEIVRYRRKEILDRLQKEFGSQTIAKISYRVGEAQAEAHFQFCLPEPLLQMSAAPQTPSSVDPDNPASAQRCVRLALSDAADPVRVAVSFTQDASQAPPPANPPPLAQTPPPSFPLSKHGQFMVFVRDDFTCSHCGRRAPEVPLCAAPAEPPPAAGSSHVARFVTNCAGCTKAPTAQQPAPGGPTPRLSEFELRRDQLELMIALEKLSEYWSRVVPGYCLNQSGRHSLSELMSRFAPDEISDAMQIAANRYLEHENGRPTKNSVENAWQKVGGICWNAQEQERKPYIKDLYIIRATILKPRFPDHLDEQEAIALMKRAARLGVDLDSLTHHSKTATTYEAWRSALEAFIAERSGKTKS